MSDITVRRVLSVLGFKVDDAKLKAANREVDKTKKETVATDKAAKQLEGQFGKTASAAELGFGKASRAAQTLGGQLDKTAAQTSALDKHLAGLGGKLAGGLAGAFAFQGLQKFGQFIGESADRIGELDAATAALPGGIERAVAATGGLADNFNLATAGAAALRAGLVENGDQFGAFAGDVARLARAAGDDVGTAVGKMVEELKGGSTALLEQYGVVVDAEGAIASYAATQGKLVEDLTDAQKKHAVTTAAMEAMHAAAGRLGPAIDSNADRIKRAGVRVDNLKDGLRSLAVTASGEVIGAIGGVVDSFGQLEPKFQNLEQLLQGVRTELKGVGDDTLETVANLALGGQALDEFMRNRTAKGRGDHEQAREKRVKEQRDAEAAREAAARGDDKYQLTPAQLRAQKRYQQELDAAEEEEEYRKLKGRDVYGPEAPDKKKPGKPGPAYELTSLGLIRDALGGDDDLAGVLGPRGKTAKKLSVEQLYAKLRRTRDPNAKEAARAKLDRHFMDLLTGGSPAGAGPGASGAQGLGTRIINIDARIDATVNVPAPEGLVGAGEVAGRRIAQDLGRGIGEALDPYFAEQAITIRRAVEG